MTTMKTAWRLTALAAAALLAACGSVPKADAPPVLELPPPFVQGQDIPFGGQARSDWWAVLGDPVLDTLVVKGLEANLDVQRAAERVRRSRALASFGRADRGPTGSLAAGGRVQQLSRTEAPGQNRDERRTETVSTGVNFSWEIDLFGRLDSVAQAAEARSEVAAGDADAMRLSIAGEIAQVWFSLNGARAQSRLTREVIDNRRSTLDLVLKGVNAGYHAPLDEVRARSELAAAEAELPSYEAAQAVATHRLAVLLGVSPSGYIAPEAAAGAPQALALRLPDPSQWVALRPDLRAAEAQLSALALDVTAVRAEFMPKVSIVGMLGFVAGSLTGLGAAGSASWFVAPTVSLPIFDLDRIKARLEAARADQRGALLAYRQRVLLATEEVESALVQVHQGQLRLAALHEQARHAVSAEALARKRFGVGASDMLELLDAQRGAQRAELGLAAAHAVQRQHIIDLQRALGARFVPADGFAQGSGAGRG